MTETPTPQTPTTAPSSERFHIPPQVKISLMWASLLTLYLYNDYLLFFIPGQIEGMNSGSFGPFGQVTELKLLATAAFLAVPCCMIFLSSFVAAGVSRWLNLIISPLQGIPNALTLLPLFGAPLYFRFIVGIEIIITVLILWTALRGMRREG